MAEGGFRKHFLSRDEEALDIRADADRGQNLSKLRQQPESGDRWRGDPRKTNDRGRGRFGHGKGRGDFPRIHSEDELDRSWRRSEIPGRPHAHDSRRDEDDYFSPRELRDGRGRREERGRGTRWMGRGGRIDSGRRSGLDFDKDEDRDADRQRGEKYGRNHESDRSNLSGNGRRGTGCGGLRGSQSQRYGRDGSFDSGQGFRDPDKRKGFRPRRIGFPLAQTLAIKDTQSLVLRIVSSAEAFEEYLAADLSGHEDSIKLLRMLNQIRTCVVLRENVSKISQMVCSSNFLNNHLIFVAQYLQEPSRSEDTITEIVEMIVNVLSFLCEEFPSAASKAIVPLSYLRCKPDFIETLKKVRPSLEKDLNKCLSQAEVCMKMINNKTSVARNNRNRSRRGPNEDDEIPPDDFTQLPVVPTQQDMEWSEKPFLRANKEEGSFKDAQHYLDVQFRLMREDYIRPLRKGIKEFREIKCKREQTRKVSDLRLYHGVRIVGVRCKKYIEHCLQFNTEGLKRVRWESSKRFIFGSLICLSSDNFNTMYFATISEREPKDLALGYVQVKFENGLGDIFNFSSSQMFIMAEMTGAYFEAYRHVLEGLQEFGSSVDTLPFVRYLVECKVVVKPPAYLLVYPMPPMNLTSLLHHDHLKEGKNGSASEVSVINPKTWPSVGDTVLNESQMEAVQVALSKELAIVQGPPGTGKTYVGLHVTKLLLENQSVWTVEDKQQPILVVCYTNHALDQFLEGIQEFCPEGLIRVGSRSKTDSLEKFNLKTVRRKHRENHDMDLSTRNSIRDCERTLAYLRVSIEKWNMRFKASKCSIVRERTLKPLMLEEHFKSLTRFCKREACMHGDMGLIFHWLCYGILSDGHPQNVNLLSVRLEKSVDPAMLDTLPQCLRAELYRLWHLRAYDHISERVCELEEKKKSRQLPWEMQRIKKTLFQLQTQLQRSRTNFFPDDVLAKVMDGTIHFKIKTNVKYRKHPNFCIRTWLNTSGKEVQALQAILNPCLAPNDDDDDGADDDKDDTDDPAGGMDDDEGQWYARILDDDDEWMNKQSTFTFQDAVSEISIMQIAGWLSEKEFANKGTQMKQTPQNLPAVYQKKEKLKFFHQLQSVKPMTSSEAEAISDLWDPKFGRRDRLRLYMSWVWNYMDKAWAHLKEDAKRYDDEARRLDELRFKEDMDVLQEAHVIGMTTTGAARYRSVLSAVACPIIIIEEAAEVLEAHVVTTLHKKCQHLILIGDHQQLKPSPTVYELCKRYKLDLSLFERLVNNHLPHATLAVQHRMRPEIARYVRFVYPELQDHPSTQNRERIRGLKQEVFFFHHEEAEDTHDDTGSRSNLHEAELCVRLCRYLLLQGYPPDTVTILTAYTGQVLVLKDIIGKDREFYKGVRVTAVDNYQGEENDIIILSLVRNNEEGSVGFLGTDNRICVALSRARNGFYAFGNFNLLTEKSRLWRNVIETAKEHGQFGEAIVLGCENHPDTLVNVSCPKDFDKAPEGGCMLPCQSRLDQCGHMCRLPCHGYDKDHSEYRCLKKCERVCKNKHPCPKKCHEECGHCDHQVEKVVPMCGHKATMACHKDPHTWRCTEKCDFILPCGHKCNDRCYTCKMGRMGHVEKCQETVEKLLPCGHVVESSCHVTPSASICTRPCNILLDCGHNCQGTCGQCWNGRIHVSCKARCDKVLEGCGHKCTLTCGSKCLPCKKPCRKACPHVACSKACGEPCDPCTEPCILSCWHKECRSKCSQSCQSCEERCNGSMLDCPHKCRGLCFEYCICPTCDKKLVVPLEIEGTAKSQDRNPAMLQLPICGHIFEVKMLDVYVETKLKNMPLGSLLTCPAPTCPQTIGAYDTWRYSARLMKRHDDQQKLKKQVAEKMLVPSNVQMNAMKSAKVVEKLKADVWEHNKIDYNICSPKEWNANSIFVFTYQCKCLFILAAIAKLQQSKVKEDLFILLAIVKERLGPVLTDQCLQQLTTETKLLTLKHLALAFIDHLLKELEAFVGLNATLATHTRTTRDEAEEILRLIQTCQKALESDSQVKLLAFESDLQEILGRHKFKSDTTNLKGRAEVLLSILNAPPEKELFDILLESKEKYPSKGKLSNYFIRRQTCEQRAVDDTVRMLMSTTPCRKNRKSALTSVKKIFSDYSGFAARVDNVDLYFKDAEEQISSDSEGLSDEDCFLSDGYIDL